MIKPLLLAAGIVFLALTPSWSAEKNEKLEKLAKAVQQVVEQNKEPTPAQPGAYPNAGRMLLSQLRNAMARNDSVQIEMALQGLSGAVDSEPLRKQCEDFSTQMRVEREAREKKSAEEINAALKRAAEAVRAAKKAADLDNVLHELGQLGERRNEQQSSNAVSNALNKVQPLQQFVARWQDYLANLASGNTQAAAEALNQLAGNNNMNQPDLIPRSEILARIQSLRQPRQKHTEDNSNNEKQPDALIVEKPLRFDKSTRTIVFEIKKLDELKGVVEAFEDLKLKPEFGGFNQSINAILETLLPLNRAYLELKAGLPTNIEITTRNLENSQLQSEVVPLRAELILLALPRYLGLPPKSAPKPGEGPYDFLARITDEAIARNDYLLASRARETQRLLQEGSRKDPNTKSQSELFVSANNQEVAGQYALAVLSYERALASGTDLVPPKIIGERLDAIKKDHPKEFQQGFDLYLSPPMQRYPSGYPYPPGYRPGMPMEQPTPPAAPVLPVPASAPSATPAKK